MVQGSIPQEIKWQQNQDKKSYKIYSDLTKPFWKSDITTVLNKDGIFDPKFIFDGHNVLYKNSKTYEHSAEMGLELTIWAETLPI